MILMLAIGALNQSSFAAEQLLFTGDLHNPVGMVYDKDGTLFIAEWGSSRVCGYDAQGKRTPVTNDVGRPSGLAFDDDGNLYIVGWRNNNGYGWISGTSRLGQDA